MAPARPLHQEIQAGPARLEHLGGLEALAGQQLGACPRLVDLQRLEALGVHWGLHVHLDPGCSTTRQP